MCSEHINVITHAVTQPTHTHTDLIAIIMMMMMMIQVDQFSFPRSESSCFAQGYKFQKETTT